MAKRRQGAADAPGQLLIEWNACKTVTPPALIATHHPQSPPTAPLVQRLPWDFRDTFPRPLQEAIDNGHLDEGDTEPENLRALHDDYSRECLALLKALDAVAEARRHNIDPATGKAPPSPKAAETLHCFLRDKERLFDNRLTLMMGTYSDAFGSEAAEAFTKALRARHAGIEVVAETRMSSDPAAQTMVQAPKVQPIETPPQANPLTPACNSHRRIVARLSVPRPLAEAVKAGHFGLDEEGKPVRPSPDEVRAITQQHAEKLIDLLETTTHVAPPAQQQLATEYEAGIKAYAESFGDHAAEQLAAYVHRQASLGRIPRTARRGR